MPRKFKLYWDKNNKYWFKKFDGKKVYFGKGKSKYLDPEAYHEAVAKYEEYLEEHRDKLATKNRVDHFRVDGKGERPKNTIGGCIDRYYVMNNRRMKNGKISIARLKAIRGSMRLFESFLGTGKTTKTYEPGGPKKWLNYERMSGYFKRLSRKVEEGTYVTGTAHLHWCLAVDFLHYCYENEWIDAFPRGLNRLKFDQYQSKTKGRGTIKVFSVSQARELFKHAHERSLYPMDLWISLALNCGFTSVDIGTLRDEHLIWDNKKENIVRIQKERTKTNQYGEWLIWKSTNILLKRWLSHRAKQPHGFLKEPDLVFFNKYGNPVNAHVALHDRTDPRSILHRDTGYINDCIGRTFRYKVKDHFPEMTGLSFKVFRKSGVSELIKQNFNNSLLIEQLYLAHKPISVARVFYSRIDADTLDDALKALEKVYSLHDMIETPEERKERKRRRYNATKSAYRKKRRAELKDK